MQTTEQRSGRDQMYLSRKSHLLSSLAGLDAEISLSQCGVVRLGPVLPSRLEDILAEVIDVTSDDKDNVNGDGDYESHCSVPDDYDSD